MENGDLSTDNCGKPMTDVEVRLISWEEGDYLVTDKPNPRGEILLGGDPIAKGYFAPRDGQDKDFFVSEGRRWFRTGDIGEFDSKGESLGLSLSHYANSVYQLYQYYIYYYIN